MPSTSRHCFGKSSGRITSTRGRQREDVSLRLETRNPKLKTASGMKLASLKRGGRDGTLVVVSRDLSRAVAVPQVALNLQAALDNWSTAAPQLESVYKVLNQGTQPDAFPLEPSSLAVPLPRAHQWLDGSAYLSHVELARQARRAKSRRNFAPIRSCTKAAPTLFSVPVTPFSCLTNRGESTLKPKSPSSRMMYPWQ